ncbi:bifunctional riboflavin kinase/FAD synthetase [Stenoxybacter acetivorans]|uniref:bifunctional riboflavin kinase/FAD synthetase n=1 Tax=Stenoxybacter acetivorans TaxID=422441 RepID=UPI00056519FA|nr:bifunctional riboflavin kinase/FAD synthetase [Stenoxybacter acetivorans]
MQIYFGSLHKPFFPQGAAVTIGNFDGVHLGHRHIAERLNQEARARGLGSVAVVFEPQPPEFFAGKNQGKMPYRLTPLRDKLLLLGDTDCFDAVWVLRFNQAFAAMTANDFIRRVLIDDLNTRYLLVGDDFRFGAQRGGDFALLRQQTAFTTENTPSVLVADVRASSTGVRQALASGDLVRAAQLLGHDYVLSGHVKHGAKMGRDFGCPTANIHLPPHHYAMSGVFVVDVSSDHFARRRGVASFGFNPTVSQGYLQKLEAHVFDWQGDLYGQRVSVHFLHKLRDEVKFADLAGLKTQIQADMAAARAWQV